MREFFKENNRFGKLATRIFLAIIVGSLIIGGAVYFWGKKEDSSKSAGKGIATGNSQNCGNIPELPDSTLKLATKIIDGDTFLIEGGYSVRILGIDADERGYTCYEAAKNKLEELVLNKEVKLEKGKEDKDQWCRYLRYVSLPAFAEPACRTGRPACRTGRDSAGKDGQNISLELIKEGLAVARFSPEDIKYREEITRAEKEAKENKIGCKWGEVEIKEESAKKEFQWEKLTTEKLGFDVIGACQAGKYLGRELIVEGKIADTYHALKSNTVFLNFEKAYPKHCFTGVIFSSNVYKFVQNPEKFYSGKTVRIMGEVKEYQGGPEIILETPNQIEVGE